MRRAIATAAATPTPEVLAALAGALTELRDWLVTVEAPPPSSETHRSLVLAVGMAARAVDPAFTGNRAALAREAFARVEMTRPALRAAAQNNQTPPTAMAVSPAVAVTAR